jgi:hypothetical protein
VKRFPDQHRARRTNLENVTLAAVDVFNLVLVALGVVCMIGLVAAIAIAVQTSSSHRR